MNAKKIIKIIGINILLGIVLLLFLELFCINKKRIEANKYRKDNHYSTYQWSFTDYLLNELLIYKYVLDNKYYDKKYFRKPEFTGKNNSIILTGCSFTFGNLLKNDETFSYKLAKHTNYNVLNFGISGASPRETLYILKQIPQHRMFPDYVIYTFITDHKIRLQGRLRRSLSPSFIYKNGHLEYSKLKSLYENVSRLNFYISQYFLNKNYNKNKNRLFNLFCLYMKEINAEIKKKFSDKTQFVILVYSDTENDFNNENEQVKDLENDGIKIIRLSDILGFDINTLEYQIDYDIDHHPNAKAWDAVVPALAKELKLQRL